MQNTDTNEILLFQLILTEMMSDNLALLDLKNLKNIKLKKHCLNLKNQIKKEFNQNYYKKFDELANGSDLINYQKFYAQFIIEFVNSSTNERDSLIKSFLESRGHNVLGFVTHLYTQKH
jgi:hypothetical protein